MKQIIYILILVFALGSCNIQTAEKVEDKNSIGTLQTIEVNKQPQDIYIKDKSLYDPIFIDGLTDYNEPIKLIDNYIVNGKDTAYFPEDLNLNKATIFKARKDNIQYVLTVTRTNMTNLNYDFQLIDKDNKTVDTKSGRVILCSSFFLGPEGDNDIEGGYGSHEYRDNGKDSWLSIRIEIGKAEDGKQRAKIHYGFNDSKKKSLDLDECPTLRTN